MNRILFGAIILILFSCNENKKNENQYTLEKIGNDSIFYQVDSNGYFVDSMKLFFHSKEYLIRWNQGLIKDLFISKNNRYYQLVSLDKIKENGVRATVFMLKDSEEYTEGPCHDSSMLFFARMCKIEGLVYNPIDTSTIIIRNIIPDLTSIKLFGVRKHFKSVNYEQIMKIKADTEDSLRVGIQFAGISNYVYKAFPVPKISGSDSTALRKEEEEKVNYGEFLNMKVGDLKTELINKGYSIEKCNVKIDNMDMLTKSFSMLVNNKYDEKFEITIIMTESVKVENDFCDKVNLLNTKISKLGVKAL